MPHMHRLSPSGAHVVAESGTATHTILVDGVAVTTDGIQPVWIDETTILYSDTRAARIWKRTLIYERDGPHSFRADVLEQPFRINKLDANWLGQWAGEAPPQPALNVRVTCTWDRREFVACGAPTISPHGEVVMSYDGVIVRADEGANTWTPIGGVGIGRLPKFTDGGLTWLEQAPRQLPVVRPKHWWVDGADAEAHYAIPIWTVHGPWLLRVEDRRCVLHPKGHPGGYVVTTGVTKDPDARARVKPQAHAFGIRVVATDGAGGTFDTWVDLNAPRVDLRGPVIVAVPSPPPEPTKPILPPHPKPIPKPEPKPMPVKPYPPEGWVEDQMGPTLHEWAEKHEIPAGMAHTSFVVARACARVVQDYQLGLTVDQAVAKHLREARQEIGLSTDPS